ncbi:unnamed protein product, partial [Ilex paraguariensis]
AIAKLGWEEPTAIQEKAIPLLLNGKDVLMREEPGLTESSEGVKALILAPSKELCNQIHAHILQLTCKCSRDVTCVDLSPQVDVSIQKPLLLENPQIVVATPVRALLHLKSSNLSLKKSLDMLVIDEADLMFSLGYENEVKEVLNGKRKKDKESGVARGIDFQYVTSVINFDFPLDVAAYVHRAGRTARGTNKGVVLSFVNLREQSLKDEVEDYIREGLRETTEIFQQYKFNLQEVEGFRYRARDAWRAVTRIAVREARLKEIKQEIFNSKRLK